MSAETFDLDAALAGADPEEELEAALAELTEEPDDEPYECRACCAGSCRDCSGNGCECRCGARARRERARLEWIADDPRI
jgi:hypothetical protein